MGANSARAKTRAGMAAFRKTDTRAEVLLRKHLWSAALRGYRKYADLPGKPDLYFPRTRLVVFVDGCFWHGCPEHFRMPKCNLDYWTAKIARNRQRDQVVTQALREGGLAVVRFWEHEVLGDPDGVVSAIRHAMGGR